MRFPTMFRRRVGEPSDKQPVDQLWLGTRRIDPGSPANDWRSYLIPELGSDGIPLPGQQSPGRRDNLHESRLMNVNGFPGQRVCVGYQGPSLVPVSKVPSLLAELVLYDETSGSWFQVPASIPGPVLVGSTVGVLRPRSLTYFDPPCLLDHSRAKRGPDDESHMSGSLEVLLLVYALTPGGAEPRDEMSLFPQGVYTFVMGTDVSNPA